MFDKLFYIIFFGLILALSRIIPHPPNFTPILACAIVAPLLVKDRYVGMAIPIVAMFFSDIIIGFHPYQLVVYSSILLISIFSPMKKNYIKLGFTAIGASVWFFITTNFAVWIIWDYYPKTIEGLIYCYTLAIPFFTNTIISTFLFTILLTYLIKYIETLNIVINKIITSIFIKT